MNFDASAVRPRSRERPFRYAPVSVDKMARIPPVGIGKDCPYLREASSHGRRACVSGSADVRARRGFEDTILRHERHEGIDIVTIPCLREGLQVVGRHIFADRSLAAIVQF